INNAAMQLERELARLSVVPDGEVVDRRKARSTFVVLLTEFRAVSASSSDEPEASVPGSADSIAHHHLVELGSEFGVDTAAAMARRRIGAGSMPEAIEAIWERDESTARTTAPLALENALAGMLRLVAPLVRGEGRFSSAERRRLGEIETLAYGHIRPMLTRATRKLDSEGNRIADASVIFVLALMGFGVAAALFNFFAIFRPLERVVMASQAEILAERDKAVAARIAKRNFLSVVSHELRTPMNGVLGFASLLAASELKPGQRKQVEIIQSSGKALLSLVDEILDFSKLEAGSLELEDENFSIEDVVSDVVVLLRGVTASKRLEMSVYLDARLPERSRGDANRLRQILTNLVGNAIKFTDSGTIGIEAREVFASSGPHGGFELEFAVSDTGIGIAADKTDLIFERFTQIDSSARRKCGGTGLGLAICKQLVDRMGGRIWVESTPGAGSTFFVRIPLAAATPPVAEPEWCAGAVAADGTADISPGETGSGETPGEIDDVRILLVEDNRAGQHPVLEMLSRSRYRVDTVADGREAVRAVALLPYDLILMDIRMPIIGGVETTRRIRALGGGASRMPIIALTANVQDEDVADYIAAGMQDVVAKPVDRDILLAAIDVALDVAGGADEEPVFRAAAE
ncbi:MAG: ATP-binding protein, partial [Limibaculum sp.]